jgi:hypothetical protein
MSALEDLKKSVENKGTGELTALEFLLLFFVDDDAVSSKELAECQEKAAAELTTLRAALDEAREALQPFATEAADYGVFDEDNVVPRITTDQDGEDSYHASFTIGDLRRAAAFLAKYPKA